jgi:methylphosphotriester-DNA--protein-cysteine methyltransferase
MRHAGTTVRYPLMDRPRQALGGYRAYDPSPVLDPFVESVWIHRPPDDLPPAGPAAMHRVLPDPALSLAFYCRRERDGIPLDPRMIVIGPKTRPQVYPFRHGQEIAAVRVKLEWAPLLVDLRPDDHLDREDALAGVLPKLAAGLLARLCETRSAAEAAATLARVVAGRTAALTMRGAQVSSHAMDLVRRSAGRISVEQVAHRLGISLRTLRRQVRLDTGVSLKHYARVTRFVHAMTMADRCPRPSWVAIAADGGYCDQSHLVRECRALAGLAPGEVHRERKAQAEISNTC